MAEPNENEVEHDADASGEEAGVDTTTHQNQRVLVYAPQHPTSYSPPILILVVAGEGVEDLGRDMSFDVDDMCLPTDDMPAGHGLWILTGDYTENEDGMLVDEKWDRFEWTRPSDEALGQILDGTWPE